MTNTQLTDERLVKILSETQATIMEHNSRCVRGSVEVDARLFESMIMELQERRKAAMDSEPVADVVAWSHPTEERTCDIRWRRHDVEPGPLYRHAQPAPVVPDESYQQLSELYHAQEKRLFKIAQRIKGPAFDKYSHASSQAIDVLEAAIFGENEACRAAMLQELPKSAGAPNNCRSNENVQVESRCGTKATPALDSLPKKAESRCGNSLANDTNVVKRLTITLPDTSSKAFWSGTGKTETFHPVTYRRWVKEAIERYCAIARIDVEVK